MTSNDLVDYRNRNCYLSENLESSLIHDTNMKISDVQIDGSYVGAIGGAFIGMFLGNYLYGDTEVTRWFGVAGMVVGGLSLRKLGDLSVRSYRNRWFPELSDKIK